jgi:hypothetical protein
MNTTARLESLHIIISTIVITYVAAIQKLFATNVLIDPYVDQLVAWTTSLGFYRFLWVIALWLANHNTRVLKLLWGSEYIHGIWTYSYEFNGERRYGIWRIIQTVNHVSITGYGVDDNHKMRSTFKSITPLVNNQGMYEIVFLRTVVTDPDRQHIAKTTLYLDTLSKGRLHAAPKVIRSQTIILGGPESGISHVDVVVRKQEGAASEDDIVASLCRSNANREPP